MMMMAKRLKSNLARVCARDARARAFDVLRIAVGQARLLTANNVARTNFGTGLAREMRLNARESEKKH